MPPYQSKHSPLAQQICRKAVLFNFIVTALQRQGVYQMSLQCIKTEIFQELEILFNTATVDELAGDTASYVEKLTSIAKVADALGISTKIITVTLNLKELSNLEGK